MIKTRFLARLFPSTPTNNGGSDENNNELNNVIVVVVILIGFWDLHPREGGLGTQPLDGCVLSFLYDPVYGPDTPPNYWVE